MINRSAHVVTNYFENTSTYGKNYTKGRPSSTSDREKRLVLRDVINKRMSLMQAKVKNGIKASKQTIWRVCKSTKYVKFLKMKSRLKLKAIHKTNRLEWSRKHMSFGQKWQLSSPTRKNSIWTDRTGLSTTGMT